MGGGTGTSNATASASTGNGGSGGAPTAFVVGDGSCGGKWYDFTPIAGMYGGKQIDESGALSAFRAIPPSYPASFTSFTFPLVANVPMYNCAKVKARAIVYVGPLDAPPLHPDVNKTRIIGVDTTFLTWTKKPNGVEWVNVQVVIDPPLIVNDGEALWGGPVIEVTPDGGVCTRYCADSMQDPNSWWSDLNAQGTIDPCPGVRCDLTHLYLTPDPATAKMYLIDTCRNTTVAMGTLP
jgi:hypothetical protein